MSARTKRSKFGTVALDTNASKAQSACALAGKSFCPAAAINSRS
jgi:hypothetical protein